MKISALEEYALRCLLQLAKSDENTPVSAEEISSKELLSNTYTEKILQKLSKAGFVKSIRGTKGGYVLALDPKNIVVGHVIRSVDGSFSSDLCNHFSGTGDECAHITGCGIRPLWANIYKYIYEILDNTSLFDLMKEEQNTVVTLEKKFSDYQKQLPAKLV